jgi:hypothetical protein
MGFYKDISSRVLNVWFLQRYLFKGSHSWVFTKIFIQRFSFMGFYKDIYSKVLIHGFLQRYF